MCNMKHELSVSGSQTVIRNGDVLAVSESGKHSLKFILYDLD